MAVNFLPQEYKNELRFERIRRLVIVAGLALFLIIAANMILLSPLWFLFKAQEKESLRELEAIKQSQTFLRLTDIEAEITTLNTDVREFEAQEKKLFELVPFIKSVLDRRPRGISISSMSYTAVDPNKRSKAQLVISGRAKNRELLLSFTKASEADNLFKKVHSPISNLLKEADFDYSLTFDLND